MSKTAACMSETFPFNIVSAWSGTGKLTIMMSSSKFKLLDLDRFNPSTHKPLWLIAKELYIYINLKAVTQFCKHSLIFKT